METSNLESVSILSLWTLFYLLPEEYSLMMTGQSNDLWVEQSIVRNRFIDFFASCICFYCKYLGYLVSGSTKCGAWALFHGMGFKISKTLLAYSKFCKRWPVQTLYSPLLGVQSRVTLRIQEVSTALFPPPQCSPIPVAFLWIFFYHTLYYSYCSCLHLPLIHS